MAALAAELAETASSLVATYDDDARPGALAGDAASLVRDARDLLNFAVAYERQRGTSWQALSKWPDLNGDPSAEDLYADTVRQINEMLTEGWLLGDAPDFPGAPEGTADAAAAASRLDRWVADRMPGDGPPGAPYCLFPVSAGLEEMDTAERSSFLAAAESVIAGRRSKYGPNDASVRPLELGIARRRVELYEHMLADEIAGKPVGASPADLNELLSAARSRLAELKAAG
jgi:hypothetical protein